MGDLIRREELLTSQFVHTECYLQANKDRHYDVYKKGWNDALQAAYDNAPAVDAIEVVRCEDCKLTETDGTEVLWCEKMFDLHGFYEEVKPNHYCGYGKRKEETDG